VVKLANENNVNLLTNNCDSHGFCILNNISIGAAYAMNMYREKIKKVAIIDFGFCKNLFIYFYFLIYY
jgi:hypothetical protein